MIQQLCMPALMYLIFMVMHISIDVYYKLYNMVLIKLGIATIGTLLLNVLCENNMSVISWLIVSIPFVMMTVIAVYILMMLGLNPATGKSKATVSNDPPNSPPSIYATPISVNTPYYGTLANSIRSVQSNYS
jgi:hypothetical protein